MTQTPLGTTRFQLTIETERETDGRWIAEIPDIPGAMAYGNTEEQAGEGAESRCTGSCYVTRK
jgi:predicted RNase H-like HicB family nuclease